MAVAASNGQMATQMSSQPSWLFRMVPLLQTLRTYKANNLIVDVPTAITQAVLHIPQSMAYALLAGVSPIYGLYVSFIPPIVYALVSSTRHVSIGTFAVISILCHGVLNKHGLIPDEDTSPHIPERKSIRRFSTSASPFSVSLPKLSTTSMPMDDDVTLITQYVDPSLPTVSADIMRENIIAVIAPMNENLPIEMLCALSLLVGVSIFLMGLLRFGSFSRLLSPPLVSAFTCGASLHVACSQLPPIFGVNFHQKSGPFSLPVNMWMMMERMPYQTNWYTFACSAVCVIILLVGRMALQPITSKYPWIPDPPPIELGVIAFSTWVTVQFRLSQRFNIAVVGNIPADPPSFRPPRLSMIDWQLALDGILISFLIAALMLSLVKLYAPTGGGSQPNRQLAALGIANIVGSFFFCFPSAPSLSRSSVLRGAENCTPMANIYCSAILLLALLYLGPLFASLPKCVLSCIVLLALKGLLMQMTNLADYIRNSKGQAIVWICTYVPTVLFDLYIGFLAGITVSLVYLLIQWIRPQDKPEEVSTEADIEQLP